MQFESVSEAGFIPVSNMKVFMYLNVIKTGYEWSLASPM